MRRTTFKKGDIIDLTREILHGFYSRSIDHLTDYLSEDFIWIGAFDFQFATTKQQFLDIIQSELHSIPFQIKNEYYDLITRDRDTFILYCKFNLTTELSDGTFFQAHTRLSIVWKYINNELKLIHIHGSNAQDVPLSTHLPINTEVNASENFINYITASIPTTPRQARMFRLVTKGHHILFESDILYLQAEGAHTRVYTKENSVLISGILRTHQETLSNLFFRAHKSYLINTDYLTSLRRYQVTLCNKIELPVGKEKYLELKQLYNN